MRRPCVVDDCRQSTEFGKRTIDEALDVAIACDVARAKSGRRAKRIGGFASVRFMDIVDDDTRAFGGEARGDAATESGAGARHDGDFVGEPHDQSCRTTTVFSVVNPYSASKPFSRPYPECLTPPKGSSTPPPAP